MKEALINTNEVVLLLKHDDDEYTVIMKGVEPFSVNKEDWELLKAELSTDKRFIHYTKSE